MTLPLLGNKFFFQDLYSSTQLLHTKSLRWIRCLDSIQLGLRYLRHRSVLQACREAVSARSRPSRQICRLKRHVLGVVVKEDVVLSGHGVVCIRCCALPGRTTCDIAGHPLPRTEETAGGVLLVDLVDRLIFDETSEMARLTEVLELLIDNRSTIGNVVRGWSESLEVFGSGVTDTV